MRYLRLAAGLLLLLRSLPATVISGNIVNLTGQPMSSNRTVQFTLENCGGNIPLVIGSSIIVPATATMVPNPAGILRGTLVGNDIISCGTVLGQTYYQVNIYAGSQLVYTQNYMIAGPTWNLSTAIPLANDPTAFMDIGNSHYAVGDLIYGSGDNALSILHGLNSTTIHTLCSQGNGSVAGPPFWCSPSISVSQLPASGAAVGTYGSTSAIPVLTIDAAGRVTSISTVTNAANPWTVLSGALSYTGRVLAGTATDNGIDTLQVAGNATITGQFNGSGAGLTAASIPIAALAAGNYATKITSGTYSINISGNATTATNASTVTNGVYTNGSYSDPPWLNISANKVGLGNVQNTALSTWAGSSFITAVGTLSSGTVPWARLSGIPNNVGLWTLNGSTADYTGGNVGVGTTAPSALLSLGSSVASNKLYVYDSGGVDSYGLGIAASTLQIYAGAAGGNIAFGKFNGSTQTFTEYGRWTAGGSLGIGVTNPTYIFQAEGSNSSVGRFLSSNASLGYLDLYNSNTAPAASGFDLRMITENSAGTGIAIVDILKHATGDFTINNGDANASIALATAGGTRLFINSSGNIGIGVTNPTHQLELSTDSASKAATATWTVYSDARLKTNIRPFLDGLSTINALNPVAFEYNGLAGLTAGMTGIGLLAQDAMNVIPYSVGTFSAKLNPTDAEPTQLYDLNPGALTYVLVNAVKNLAVQTVQPVDVSQPLMCNQTTRGQHFFVEDDLLGDNEQVCGKSASGVYSFHTLTQF